jgi:hypothetical protein
MLIRDMRTGMDSVDSRGLRPLNGPRLGPEEGPFCLPSSFTLASLEAIVILRVAHARSSETYSIGPYSLGRLGSGRRHFVASLADSWETLIRR